jgi:hypothetical protein
MGVTSLTVGKNDWYQQGREKDCRMHGRDQYFWVNILMSIAKVKSDPLAEFELLPVNRGLLKES